MREPGGTVIGEQVRAILLDPRHREMAPRTEMLLFAAARAQIVAEVIAPALARGAVVVCDRYVDSSLAYQGVARGLGVDTVGAVNDAATGGLRPDLTLLLDLDPALGLRRLREASGTAGTAGGAGGARWDGGNRLDREDATFHRRVREGFLALARNDPGRFRVIDASLPVGEVQSAIREAVGAALRRMGTP